MPPVFCGACLIVNGKVTGHPGLHVLKVYLTSKDRAIIAVESLPLYEAEAAERNKQQAVAAAQTKQRDSGGKFSQPPQKVGEAGSPPRNQKSKHESEAVAQAAKAAGTNRESVRQAKGTR
jgi:hypothetical protein